MAVSTLIIEDDPATRRLLTIRLERIGCEVIGAVDNTREALDRFRALKPDLVTLDIQLPELGGIDAAALFATIRREDPHCEVIVISGSAFPAHHEQFMRGGALAFVGKPIDFDRLARDLREFFPELKPDRPRSAF